MAVAAPAAVEVWEDTYEDVAEPWRTAYIEAERERKAGIQSAIERGGMPAESEEDELYSLLQRSFDVLEGLAYRVEKIAESADGHDLPFEISLADLGVLGVVLDDVDGQVEKLRHEQTRIRKAFSSLESIRLEQKARRAS